MTLEVVEKPVDENKEGHKKWLKTMFQNSCLHAVQWYKLLSKMSVYERLCVTFLLFYILSLVNLGQEMPFDENEMVILCATFLSRPRSNVLQTKS